MVTDKVIKMNKWLLLGLITGTLLLAGSILSEELHLTDKFFITVAFFAIQAIVLFRIDKLAPEEWKVQVSMVKIIIRLLSSLVFITILVYTQENGFQNVVQFIILYLIFMIFEIVEALTNLRRN